MKTATRTLIATICGLGLSGTVAAQATWDDSGTLSDDIAAALAETPADDSGGFAFPDGLTEDGVSAADPLGRMRLGLVYDNALGPSLLFGVSHRRAFGQPVTLDFSAKLAESGQAARLQLVRAGLFGSDFDGYADLRFASRDPFDTYTTTDLTADLGVARRFGRAGARAALRFRDSAVDDVDASSSAAILEEDRQTLSLVARLNYADQTRTDAGLFAFSAGFEGEIGQRSGDGDGRYSRAIGQARLRYAPDFPVSIGLSLRAGRVSGDDLMVSERFLGGAGLMRGFEYGGIGPRDLGAANEDALGGEAFTAASLQIDTPLDALGARGWTVGAFVDWGQIWDLGDTAPAGVDDSARTRSAAGISIGWQVEDVRVQLDLSEPLEAEDYDIEETVRLSILARF